MERNLKRTFDVINVEDKEIQGIDVIGQVLKDFDMRTKFRMMEFCHDKYLRSEE